MPSIRGKPLYPGEKHLLVSVKHYFDRNKSDFGCKESSAQMTADALGLGLATVNRVIAAYHKDPESLNAPAQPRGRPAYSIAGSHQEAVRAYIRQANWQGRHITLEDIKRLLAERAPSESFHVATLGRTLDRWGFEFGKGTRTQHLKEKDHVVVARQRYLRTMRRHREATSGAAMRPEVYLDESYINQNHSNAFVWYSSDEGPWIQNPSGQGERLIIMDAITDQGWVEGARVVFTSTRNTGDYHGQMNGELFHQWFSEKLLPQIPERALIVMDNASYHNVLAEHSAPTAVCSKANIRTWLEANRIPCRDDCLKVELVEMLNKLAPAPSYVIDELAAQQGHEVVRTPPYHPELQPIETCWGVLKNEVARHGDFTMDNLKLPLERAFHKITAQTCQSIIKKVRAIEDRFWQEDALMDQGL
jgi:transposase